MSMKISRRYYIPLLSIGFCLFTGMSLYILNRLLVVSEIRLEMQKEPLWEDSMNEVRTLLQSKLKPFIGKKIWKVSEDIMQVVLSEPRVGSVKVLRLLPNRIFIQVQPRKPLLVLLNPSRGTIHPLSLEGQILPPLLAKHIPDLPILRGQAFLKQKAVRRLALRFFRIMPKQGEFSLGEISEVKYSTQDKSLIFILSKNGKPIKVGQDPERMKSKRIESVLRYLDQKNIKWRVIDARFSQKIVVSTSKAI